MNEQKEKRVADQVVKIKNTAKAVAEYAHAARMAMKEGRRSDLFNSLVDMYAKGEELKMRLSMLSADAGWKEMWQ